MHAHQPEEQKSSVALSEKFSHVKGLKKRVVKNRTSKRKEKWSEKLHKKQNRRAPVKAIKNTTRDNSNVQAFLNNSNVIDGFGSFTTFTELLMC
ncbi:hypothetical protein EJB05_45306, partial [Eragrostis curvula]